VGDINGVRTKIEKGINEAAGKIIWKEERSQRNSWLDEECQIILEDIKRAYNKMFNGNTRWNEWEYKDRRKKADKICLKKGRGGGGEYCLTL
jgi:hypothetical protein